jgi:hypothetical protein
MRLGSDIIQFGADGLQPTLRCECTLGQCTDYQDFFPGIVYCSAVLRCENDWEVVLGMLAHGLELGRGDAAAFLSADCRRRLTQVQ